MERRHDINYEYGHEVLTVFEKKKKIPITIDAHKNIHIQVKIRKKITS